MGTYDTLAEAEKVVATGVDAGLQQMYKPRMTAKQLYQVLTMFGEAP